MIPELVELGVDGLNPVQVQNDPLQVKKDFGDRLTICGGFDNQRVLDNPEATPEQIRESIFKTINDLQPGGGWIADCGFIDTLKDKAEREQIWLDCLDEYNRPAWEKYGMTNPV